MAFILQFAVPLVLGLMYARMLLEQVHCQGHGLGLGQAAECYVVADGLDLGYEGGGARDATPRRQELSATYRERDVSAQDVSICLQM